MKRSPYGLDIVESCILCPYKQERIFCNLPPAAVEDLDRLTSRASYPKGAVLFLEGQAARGIFILCAGRAKLATSSASGKTIILKLAGPGEVLGLSATVSGKPYEVTVETLEPTQANFISREHFLRFLSAHGEVALRVAQQLSSSYHSAYQEIRSLGLSTSATEKLARLILELARSGGHAGDKSGEIRTVLSLTHEEISQMIGSSRETVTRAFASLRRAKLIEVRGATLVIRDRSGLEELVSA